jgi:uncharacterized protein (TIGR02172 family)
MKAEEKNGRLILYPEGRIDSTNASEFFEEIQNKIKGYKSQSTEINMSGVEYVSSAGLRVFMKLKKNGTDFKITEVSPDVYDIFEVTGFTTLFDIRKALRTISIDGCEVIGNGFYGTIYRIDEDTIVKVYDSPDSIPLIENEQRLAKLAFLKGIPTAISYDIVKIGNSYGSVFEMLKSKNLNDLIIEEPEKADEVIAEYVDFIKLVHETEVDPGSLPYATDRFRENLNAIRSYLTDKQYDTLNGYIEQFPKDEHVVHGDFHMKNIMMADGEPMLIDMETLAAGHPIFDLAGMYVAYQEFKEDEPVTNSRDFFGISDEMSDQIWTGIMKHYFSDSSEEERDLIMDRIKLAAAVRFLYLHEITDLKNGPLGPLRIKHTQERIEELIEKVDGLYFTV